MRDEKQERHDFAERAGIAEYDGGLTRREAERVAREQIEQQRREVKRG